MIMAMKTVARYIVGFIKQATKYLSLSSTSIFLLPTLIRYKTILKSDFIQNNEAIILRNPQKKSKKSAFKPT